MGVDMLKRVILVLAILFLAVSPCLAEIDEVLGQTVTVAAGCTKGATIFADDFEDVADGEELSNDGNWVESSAVSDVVGDDAVVNAGGSTLSVLFGGATNGIYIYNSFTEITSGKATFEFYIRWSTVGSSFTGTFLVKDGGNNRVLIYLASGGSLKIQDNSTYVDIVTGLVADTFYHVEVEVDTGITNGQNATRVWIDETESTNSPFDTSGQDNPSGIDQAGFSTDSSGTFWVDDYLHYTGARCEN
jgi:hypothetical protein